MAGRSACATWACCNPLSPGRNSISAYADAAGIVELAALCTAAIVRNHPFVDGNKRTGFVVGILFLELNGFAFMASEEEAAQAVLVLAAGSLDEGGYVKFLNANIV